MWRGHYWQLHFYPNTDCKSCCHWSGFGAGCKQVNATPWAGGPSLPGPQPHHVAPSETAGSGQTRAPDILSRLALANGDAAVRNFYYLVKSHLLLFSSRPCLFKVGQADTFLSHAVCFHKDDAGLAHPGRKLSHVLRLSCKLKGFPTWQHEGQKWLGQCLHTLTQCFLIISNVGGLQCDVV